MFRKLTMVVAAPVLLVSACAHEADVATVIGEPALIAVRSAPDEAAKAGSAHFEVTVSLESPEGAFEMVSTGGYSGHRMAMEMDLGSALAGLAQAAGEGLPEGFDEPLRVVVDGTTTYLRLPMLDGLTGVKGWLSATPEELEATGGSLGLSEATSDPSQLLEMLRGVADDVESVGPDEVRGVATTRYHGTVDLDRAIDHAPAARRDQIRAQLEALDADLGSVPVDVWVDADGLARRMVVDLGAVAATAMGAGGTATMTMELFDYGQDVQIDVPDASETTPISDVLGAFGALGEEG
jgi:hypothetical protein